MRHSVVTALILSVGIGAGACSRAADERADRDGAGIAARDGATGNEITVTGCLTSAPDSGAFVVSANRNALTSGALHAGSGETPTYAYELTGNVGDLAAHVGREVEVTGHTDDDRKDRVEVDEEEKTELPEVQSGRDTVKPAIETDTAMNINVRRLEVATVTPTGQPCAAAQ
jgi:hypothetical protein